jgi:hypothetical protein
LMNLHGFIVSIHISWVNLKRREHIWIYTVPYMDMDKAMDMDTDTEIDMDIPVDIYYYWTGELGRLYTLIS